MPFRRRSSRVRNRPSVAGCTAARREGAGFGRAWQFHSKDAFSTNALQDDNFSREQPLALMVTEHPACAFEQRAYASQPGGPLPVIALEAPLALRVTAWMNGSESFELPSRGDLHERRKPSGPRHGPQKRRSITRQQLVAPFVSGSSQSIACMRPARVGGSMSAKTVAAGPCRGQHCSRSTDSRSTSQRPGFGGNARPMIGSSCDSIGARRHGTVRPSGNRIHRWHVLYPAHRVARASIRKRVFDQPLSGRPDMCAGLLGAAVPTRMRAQPLFVSTGMPATPLRSALRGIALQCRQ